MNDFPTASTSTEMEAIKPGHTCQKHISQLSERIDVATTRFPSPSLSAWFRDRLFKDTRPDPHRF